MAHLRSLTGQDMGIPTRRHNRAQVLGQQQFEWLEKFATCDVWRSSKRQQSQQVKYWETAVMIYGTALP